MERALRSARALRHGQDAVAMTSGEARNPGPKIARGGARKRPVRRRPRVAAPRPTMDETTAEYPITVARTLNTRIPTVVTTGGTTTVSFAQQIAPVLAPANGSFFVTNDIDMDVAHCGKWLADMCIGWDYYKCVSKTYVWSPVRSFNTNGQLVMWPDYDPTDSPATNSSDASAMKNSAQGQVFQHLAVTCDPAALLGGNKRKIILRQGEVQLGPTSNYKEGKLFVALEGCDATPGALLGYVIVEYVYKLMVPHIATVPNAVFFLQQVMAKAGNHTFAAVGQNDLGSFVLEPSQNLSIPVPTFTALQTEIVLPYGVYEVTLLAVIQCSAVERLDFLCDIGHSTAAHSPVGFLTGFPPGISKTYPTGTTHDTVLFTFICRSSPPAVAGGLPRDLLNLSGQVLNAGDVILRGGTVYSGHQASMLFFKRIDM